MAGPIGHYGKDEDYKDWTIRLFWLFLDYINKSRYHHDFKFVIQESKGQVNCSERISFVPEPTNRIKGKMFFSYICFTVTERICKHILWISPQHENVGKILWPMGNMITLILSYSPTLVTWPKWNVNKLTNSNVSSLRKSGKCWFEYWKDAKVVIFFEVFI